MNLAEMVLRILESGGHCAFFRGVHLALSSIRYLTVHHIRTTEEFTLQTPYESIKGEWIFSCYALGNSKEFQSASYDFELPPCIVFFQDSSGVT